MFTPINSACRSAHRISLRAAIRPLNSWALWAKRMQDVTVAGAALMIFLPVMIAIAVTIALKARGPVFLPPTPGRLQRPAFQIARFPLDHVGGSDRHASRQDLADRRPRDARRAVHPPDQPRRIAAIPECAERRDVVVGPRPHALLTKSNGVALGRHRQRICGPASGQAGAHRWALNGIAASSTRTRRCSSASNTTSTISTIGRRGSTSGSSCEPFCCFSTTPGLLSKPIGK